MRKDTGAGYATAYQLRILNTIFQKGTNHLITYSRGGGNQIYYMNLMGRKEHARESKNYTVGSYYTTRSSNLTIRSIGLINSNNFLPIDFIFSLRVFPPPVYHTGGGNACKENIKSIGRKLIKKN